jgi:hypothetical protein
MTWIGAKGEFAFQLAKQGLCLRQRAFSDLGLGFGCKSKPKPADRLGKPICSLRLNQNMTQACVHFSPATNFILNLSAFNVSGKCPHSGLVVFSIALLTGVILHHCCLG